MSLAETAVGLFYVGKAIALAITAVLLAIPVIRQKRAVLYRKGTMYYSLSIFAYTTGWLVLVVLFSGITTAQPVMAVTYLLTIAGGVLHLAGVWKFARGFLSIGPRGIPDVSEEDGADGGFENVGQ